VLGVFGVGVCCVCLGWGELLDKAYEVHGVFPTLLERDFNIPTMNILTKELDIIHELQAKHITSTVSKQRA